MADPDANVIYGIVIDESMGNAVKVTVIATGFSRTAPKGLTTPADLSNYRVTPQPVALPAAAAGGGSSVDFYRKTPGAKPAASGGTAFDLDVPTFLRRKGGEGGEP